MIKICNKIIEYSFYALFLLTPLVFWKDTSELFELNKMWLTWGLTIIIAAAWLIKMVLRRKIIFQRTPLDIPIGLFLMSQIISTIFSLDPHTSFWGYYSRFNGGLLSTISYILLYYALLSNFSAGDTTGRAPDSAHLSKAEGALAGGKVGAGPAAKMVKRLLSLSLISGLIVALWGLPSHFGYDPTCLLFRGTLDVSCWTADFMPKVRIFSTLGQPAWLAAYLAILIPIAIAFAFRKTQSVSKSEFQTIRQSDNPIHRVFRVFRNPLVTCYLLLAALFYIDLLYTNARSGFLGIWLALIFFTLAYFWMGKRKINFSFLISHFSFLIGILLLITFIIGTPIPQLRGLTLDGIGGFFQKFVTTQAPKKTVIQKDKAPTQSPISGGTESGEIRLSVWSGAINAWKANPLFGTGVETFAFAYYKYKPIGQNLTSEWNFLYNKAHNEYLNYLATTGIVGLGSYLLMIGSFIFLTIKYLKNHPFGELRTKIKNIVQNANSEKEKLLTFSSGFDLCTLIFALLASYLSILITNFFGFSVVITNIYLFMIPAFIFVLADMIKPQSKDQRPETKDQNPNASIWQWTPIFFILVTCYLLLVTLFRYWQADIAFALGYNLDRAGEYQQAYPKLQEAVRLRGNEPVFRDELSLNDAIIAAALVAQKPDDSATSDQTISVASTLAQEAINVSNNIVSQHPNNAVFWKTRVRIFYTLSQVDSRYLSRAMDAIEKASLLAPNDANIWYNLGVLYGQNNNVQRGILALEKTITLKPDYRDAHYALGLSYNEVGKKEKAIEQMRYILDHLSAKDQDARKSIEDWTRP